MERISASCAMEWSIELEKGLRSKKPGQPIEAILQVGPRLERWSREPSSTMALLDMFGLVPGEDRLFANTILLRLADAFKYGDKHTRFCILKVFLLEWRQRSRKGARLKGILAKERVPNYIELLKRVKIVFDTGDVESRALTLRLLGCWADIASDSAEVCYMILSSLKSCHAMEVKASLFAAGCFSQFSKDFAHVFLEVLINLVTSSKTSSTVKLAAVRAFAKMSCSSMLASRAYKTSRKLVLESSQEEFIVEMLMSLSKLASKSMLLISLQVDLLLSFIIDESALCIQAMAFQCIYILLARGVCRLPITVSLLTKLFHILDNTKLPAVSGCKALRILRKIFRCTKPSLSDMDMTEFVRWVSIVESATQSPITSKRLMAFHLLVDMSFYQKLPSGLMPSGYDSTSFPSQVILLVLDQLEHLAKPISKHCETVSEVTWECQSLLSLAHCMVKEYPQLGVLALTKIRSYMAFLLDVCKHATDMKIVMVEGEEHCPIASKLVFCMYKFVESCVESLNEASAVTDEVYHIMMLVIETMRKSCLYDQDTCAVDLLLLHSRVMCSVLYIENKAIYNADNGMSICHNDCWIEHEMYVLDFVKNMVTGRDNWDAYKAGKYLACQGSWFVAAYVFRQMISRVQSDACHCWLKALSLFARAESTILVLHFPKRGWEFANNSLLDEIQVNSCRDLEEISKGIACTADWSGHCKKFHEAYRDVCSAAEMLAASGSTDLTFIFQRWFLVLRAKILEAMVDTLELLNSNQGNAENIDSEQVEGSTSTGLLGPVKDVGALATFLSHISFRLNRLAQEFDRLAVSFMDMDAKCHRAISRLALNCSLLAFCTGFAVYFPNLPTHDNPRYWGVKKLKKCSPSLLVQDLIERLWHIDSEMTTNLKQFLTTISEPDSCFHVPPRALLFKAGCRERDTLDVCSFALFGVLRVQEEARVITDDRRPYQDSGTSLHLLFNILKKWNNISFQVPKHFFRVRPCIGGELFMSNADRGNRDGLSVFPGFQLSLNLCLQLKGAPPVTVTKLHCILSSKPLNRITGLGGKSKGHVRSGFQAWEMDDTADLNEKLWLHLIESEKRSGIKHKRACVGDGSVWSFASFEANERGQGFSTCLLDVSAFPAGSYKINWHSCCVDSKGSYWSLLPLNSCPVFNIRNAA